MNPVIIISTFVCGNSKGEDNDIAVLETYDHMTSLNRQGELSRCLTSLRKLETKAPVAILVISDADVAEQAQEKIRNEAKMYPDLDISVIGTDAEQGLHSRMVAIGVGDYCNGISLSGYGAMRNLGLAYAASMGYTEVIFIDDDEVIDDPLFVDKACYGLGMLTQRSVPILIKSGYYLDRNDSYQARSSNHWYNRFWRQDKGFNEWIDKAMSGPRLSSSNTACGGCLALHREAYRRVSFDPWIPRGEDLDFLLNVRMYGSEIWFDNSWQTRHLPPSSAKSESQRFIQDIYRWLYEYRKLEFSAAQIDLLRIKPSSLDPYPGPFLESSISFNIFMTALLRAIGRAGHRRGYFHAAMSARKQATNYAKENCGKYFSFQRQWPEVIAMLEEDIALKGIFESTVVEKLTQEQIDQLEYERDLQVREKHEQTHATPRPDRANPVAETPVKPERKQIVDDMDIDEPTHIAAPSYPGVDEDDWDDVPEAPTEAYEDVDPDARDNRPDTPEDQAKREKAKSPFEDILKDYEHRNADDGKSGGE